MRSIRTVTAFAITAGLLVSLLHVSAAETAEKPAPKKLDPAAVKAKIDGLVKLLGSDEAEVRRNAAITLGTLGKAAEPAIPALAKARGDKVPRVDDAVFWALAWIRYGCDEGLEKLSVAGKPDRPPYVNGRIYWLGGFQELTDAGPRPCEQERRTFTVGEPALGEHHTSSGGHWGCSLAYFDLELFDEFRKYVRNAGVEELGMDLYGKEAAPVEQLLGFFNGWRADQEPSERVVRVSLDGKTAYAYTSWCRGFHFGWRRLHNCAGPPVTGEPGPRKAQISIATSDCLRLDDTIDIVVVRPKHSMGWLPYHGGRPTSPFYWERPLPLPEAIELDRKVLSEGPPAHVPLPWYREEAAIYLACHLRDYADRLMHNGQYDTGKILASLQQSIVAKQIEIAERDLSATDEEEREGKWLEDDRFPKDLSFLSRVAWTAVKLGDLPAYVYAAKLTKFAESIPFEDPDEHKVTMKSLNSAVAELAMSSCGDLETAFEIEDKKGTRIYPGFRNDLPPEPMNAETRWWLTWHGGERPTSLEDLLDQLDAQQPGGPDPAPQMPPATAEEKTELEDLEWVNRTADRLIAARKKVAALRIQLAVQRVAAAKVRKRIAQLKQVLVKSSMARHLDHYLGEKWEELFGSPKPPDPSQTMRDRIEERVAELERQLDQILQQQDAAIQELKEDYETMFLDLEAKVSTAKSADMQDIAGRLKQIVRFERFSTSMELYLAAGLREQFRDQARIFYQDKQFAPGVRLMQALDFLENKQIRAALHALKDCARLDPNNRIASTLIRQIETGYLKAIDAKLTGKHGDAAAVWKAMDKRMSGDREVGFWNHVKDYLTTGVSSSIMAIDGTLDDLADSAVKTQSEASVQHCGLLIITRMRENGLTLSEIRNLDSRQFAETVQTYLRPNRDSLLARLTQAGLKSEDLKKLDDGQLFEMGKKHLGLDEPDIAEEDAQRMWKAVHLTFQNSDVNRLERMSKEQLDVDTDTPYFDTTPFEQSWSEWCCDAVNLKNLLIYLGPMSVLKAGGKVATTGYWGVVGGKAPEALLTTKQAFANMIHLSTAAEKLSHLPGGTYCVDQLIRFHESTGIISHMLADALVMQVAGLAGRESAALIAKGLGLDEKAAREIGQFAAEVFAAYGVGDYDVAVATAKAVRLSRAVQTMKNCGVNVDDVAWANRQISKNLNDASEAIARSRKALSGVNETLDEIASTGRVSDSLRQSLSRSSKQIDDQLAGLSQSFADSEPPALARGAVHRMRLAREAIEAAQAGKIAKATYLHRASQKIGQQLDDHISYLTRQKGVGEALEAQFRKSASAGVPDSAPGKVKGAKSVQEVLHDSGLESSMPQRKYPVDQLTQDGEVRRPLSFQGWEGEECMRAGKYQEAVEHYEDMLVVLESSGSKNSDAYAEYAEKLFLARKAGNAAKGVGELDDVVVEKLAAMRKIAKEELDGLANAADTRLVQMNTKSRNQPFWVEKQFEVDGKTVWKRVGVFKPADPEFPTGYDVRGERLYAEFARELGLAAPACAEVNRIAGKKMRGLFTRLVEGTPLKEADVGLQIALQKQVARHRVLAALLGDHDRHMGNYIFDASGRVVSIDHGMADPCGRYPDKNLEKLIAISGGADNEALIVENMHGKILDWRHKANRQLKMIQDNLDAGHIDAKKAAELTEQARQVIMLEEQLRFEDMMPTIKKIQTEFSGAEGDAKLRRLLEGVLDGKELEAAIEVIKVRRDNLFEVMRRIYALRDVASDIRAIPRAVSHLSAARLHCLSAQLRMAA